MTKEKVPNYTPEMTTELTAAFNALTSTGEQFQKDRAALVERLAQQWNKSPSSVRQKASREGCYGGKATYTTKAGGDPVTKETIAADVGAMLSLSEPEVDSLTKVTKKALLAIQSALQAFAAMREAALEAQEQECYDAMAEGAHAESMGGDE